MSRSYDIVIAGAGMVGLTTAARLAAGPAADRLNITIVDAGARPLFDPDDDVGLRVSAISPGSAAVLDELGVWETVVATRACAYEHMRVWDARGAIDDPGTLRFDAADVALPALGHIVENALLQDALLRRLRDTGIDLRFEAAIGRIEWRDGTGFDVVLGSGEHLGADLLIGADGAGSFVRRSAGIPVKAWRYPQSALVTHVRPERPHAATAWQRFLADGPLALLPLADGRVSVVWSTSPERAEEALAIGDAELGGWLTRASDAVLGSLEVAGPRGVFPLRAQYAINYALPGLVLVGDAAHSVHPLAGQGVNLGIADAQALAQCLAEAVCAGEHPGDLPALRRYERDRKGANQTMLYFIDLLNRLFLSDSPAVAGLRRTGMQLFNRIAPLRRRAVRVALGLGG